MDVRISKSPSLIPFLSALTNSSTYPGEIYLPSSWIWAGMLTSFEQYKRGGSDTTPNSFHLSSWKSAIMYKALCERPSCPGRRNRRARGTSQTFTVLSLSNCQLKRAEQVKLINTTSRFNPSWKYTD